MNANPKALGFSKERLERIDAHLSRAYLENGRLPFYLVLIARRGEIAHLSFSGLADEARGRRIEPETLVRIYSMTKPLTSVLFMMLVEEGKVALDDPVSKFIPSWGDLGVYAGGFLETFRTRPVSRPMQVIDLLRHTSGLTYGFQQRTNVDAAYRKLRVGEIEKSGTLQTMIDALAGLPLEFSPGEAWNYSVSTDVLGYLVGVIEGRPFEEVLKSRLLDPLGMGDTGFHAPETEGGRLAACYALDRGRRVLQDDPETSSFLHPPSFVSGGGGLVSTAPDYLKFCQMMLNGGEASGVRFLSPKTIALMTANHLPGGQDLASCSQSLFSEAAYAGVGFGLGFSVTVDPARTLIPGSRGEYAWGGAASTSFFIDPAEELAVVFLTQLLPSSAYPVRRELRTLVYAAMTESHA